MTSAEPVRPSLDSPDIYGDAGADFGMIDADVDDDLADDPSSDPERDISL